MRRRIPLSTPFNLPNANAFAVSLLLVFAGMTFGGCVPQDATQPQGSSTSSKLSLVQPTQSVQIYASELVSFEPGPRAGFGKKEMPQVVLGAPQGKGLKAGSLDVVSLGVGGEIVLGFDPYVIRNGPGADFVVFENPFVSAAQMSVFAELGTVSVSQDGETWIPFECSTMPEGEQAWPGCAGWSPTLVFDEEELIPLEPEKSGGDAFDLDTVGLEWVRYVKVTDLATTGQAPSAGFDLDAVGVVHLGQMSR